MYILLKFKCSAQHDPSCLPQSLSYKEPAEMASLGWTEREEADELGQNNQSKHPLAPPLNCLCLTRTALWVPHKGGAGFLTPISQMHTPRPMRSLRGGGGLWVSGRLPG